MRLSRDFRTFWGVRRLGSARQPFQRNDLESERNMLPAIRGSIRIPIWFRIEFVLAVSPSPTKRDILWDSRKRLELIQWSSDEGRNWRDVFLATFSFM